MAQAIWTPLAIAELDEILYYISVQAGRPTVGEQNYFAIRRLADEFANRSAPRHVHPAAPDGWFYFRHKRWLIFYQPHAAGIEVMRVIDASRDLPKQLSETQP